MKPKLKMELGAEPKRLVILAALVAFAGYLFYTNVFSGGDDTPVQPARPAAKSSQRTAANPAPPAADPVAASESAQRALTSGPPRSGPKEFRPSLKPRKPEERLDPASADPTLRLDILAKLAAVKIERADRSLFDFGSSPSPASAKPKLPEPKDVLQEPKKMIGPEPPPPPPPPPVKPPPPPIPLKFYGYSLPVQEGQKRVFCVLGDEIFTPAEGDLIQKRYKIIRITATTVMVEDLEHKNQQSLRIEEPPQTS